MDIFVFVRWKRKKGDPITPDFKDTTLGKRRYDGLVRNWRRKLHDYDQINDKNET